MRIITTNITGKDNNISIIPPFIPLLPAHPIPLWLRMRRGVKEKGKLQLLLHWGFLREAACRIFVIPPQKLSRSLFSFQRRVSKKIPTPSVQSFYNMCSPSLPLPFPLQSPVPLPCSQYALISALNALAARGGKKCNTNTLVLSYIPRLSDLSSLPTLCNHKRGIELRRNHEKSCQPPEPHPLTNTNTHTYPGIQ